MEMSPFPLNKLLVKLNTNKQANLKQEESTGVGEASWESLEL